jgi:hypothetical protein
MDLKVTDFNASIVYWCKIILESQNSLAFLSKEFSPQNIKDNRAEIDRNLIQMIVASQKILDLVFPIPNAGQIHGLPKEATLLGDELDILAIDKDNPNWDFKPWFSEKSGALKKAINELLETLEDPSSESYARKIMDSSMAEIQNKAQTIIDMIESGRLVIKDVKLDEDDM